MQPVSCLSADEDEDRTRTFGNDLMRVLQLKQAGTTPLRKDNSANH